MIVVTSYSVRGQFQVEESHPKCGERQCVVISKCPSILRLVLEVIYLTFKLTSWDCVRVTAQIRLG